MMEAMDALRSSERPKAMVLVSDGEDLGAGPSPIIAAKQAKASGIPVMTLMIGSPEGAKIPSPDAAGFIRNEAGEEVISRANPDLMQGVAEAGGGGFASTLRTAFPMDRLYTGELDDLRDEKDGPGQRKNLYQVLVVFALVLLLFERAVPVYKKIRFKGALPLLCLLSPLFISARGVEEDPASEGVKHYREGRYEAALSMFEKAEQRMGKDERLAVNKGLALLKLDAPHKAAACFQEATLPEARFASGAAAYRLARKTLKAIGSEKERAKALTQGLGSLKEAEEAFTWCLERKRWQEEALHNLALCRGLAKTILAALKETGKEGTGGDAPGDSGEESGPGDGAEGGKEATGEKKPGDQGASDPKGPKEAHPLSMEERMRIFALLEDLEKKRVSLERDRISKKRRTRGTRDW
jgi:tetratricopeptide (TPR) repeat protein